MIEITKENTAKAAERARKMEVKPKVRFVANRTFIVQSARNSKVDTVRFDVWEGKKFAE